MLLSNKNRFSGSAGKVLQAHWDGTLPVNPLRLCSQMGVQLKRLDSPGFAVKYSWEGGRGVISYDYSAPSSSIRFAIAHALGHHVNGDKEAPADLKFTTKPASPIEMLANYFAVDLLMPSHLVDFAIHEKDIAQVAKLAETFGVSEAAVLFKLRRMGIVS